MAKKASKKSKTKGRLERDPNPLYQRELIECFKRGYSQLPDGKGNEKERLQVREDCRAANKDSK